MFQTPFQREVRSRLTNIETQLQLILNKEAREQMTLDDVLAKVTAQKTVADSAVTLLQELKAELDAAIASGDMTKVQAISDAIDANTNELSAAVTANTPTTPVTPTP